MARALQDISVLVVEDEVDTRELLELGLGATGATVKSALSAEDALALLEDWRPDVILCDLELPGIDGYTFLELLRANPRLRTIPAAALSGTIEKPRDVSLQATFEKMLRKPTKLPEIVLALATLARNTATTAPTEKPSGELRGVLQTLNAATGCRFTSLLLFNDDGTLTSLWTYDRDRPHQDPFPLGLPVHASYCVLVRDAKAVCVVENATPEARTTGHPKRDELACYAGAPLFKTDGTMLGTVCCYDSAPRTIDQATRDNLDHAAREVEPWLRSLLEH